MELKKLVDQTAHLKNKVVAVAAAEDDHVIACVSSAVKRNMASFLLYGNKTLINSLLKEYGIERSKEVQVYHAESNSVSAREAVKAVSSGKANVLMKGMVSTSVILKEVLNPDYGLRTGNILSHVAFFEVPGYDRLIVVTDAGMNISPDLEQKKQIINNAVKMIRSIGVKEPRVAPLTAVEMVNPEMPSTIDAAALSQMNKRGQIEDCIIDGPLALDNAISIDAAKHKGIRSEVAGKADILIVPNIESGNILYKSLVHFANAKVGGVIAGAKVPIVVTSRADTAETKLYSLALAVYSAS